MLVAREPTLKWPLLISTAGHALVLAIALLSSRFALPAPPIPIEVQPAHHAARRVAPVEKRAPPPREPVAPPRPGAGSHKRPKPTPLPPPPDTADLSPFAPDDAHLVVLLRMDKLRASPHRAGTEALLAALPDWSTLVTGSGVSPLDDFEALLIATSDPHDVTATFLAARYADSPRVHALAGRTLPDGDPRVFRELGPGLTVLTRPDGARALAGPGDLGADARRNWLAQLAQFDKVAATPNGPALLVTLADAPSLIRFGDGLPTPLTIAIAATAEASPSVRVRLAFTDAAAADAFARAWPTILGRYRTATALLGLAGALDGLKLATENANVELAGHVPEGDTRLALGFARALLPAARLDGDMR